MPPTENQNIQGESRAMADNRVCFHHRERFTAAQVNAGATVIRCPRNFKIRVADMALIAIGGAASGATSVDVKATQGGAAVNLLAAAIAGLTQNTLLRAGAANAAILAGGASFVANDADKDVTIGKTGANLATATHIDVLISYTFEKA